MMPHELNQLGLDARQREQNWQWIGDQIERYWCDVASLPVAPALDLLPLRRELEAFDFAAPQPPLEALRCALAGLRSNQVHTPHPRYFGLFNPAPTAMGVVADALVAAFNPQIAAWSHNPFAAEVERHLIRTFGIAFGYPPASVDGVFTSGGAEANHTALLCALTQKIPAFGRDGAAAAKQLPAIFVGALGHDSVLKAARMCGIGTRSVHAVPVDGALRMTPAALEQAFAAISPAQPVLVVATAGSTSAGVVDDLQGLGELAHRYQAWFHVDAAWGGFAALLPELRPWVAGLERADSITFDAHKSLSVPMGAGMFLTRHPDILERTFRVGADYMPRDGDGASMAQPDPFAHSMQWSRRFIGLKLFLSLAVAGWPGYLAALRHQCAMGDLLRQQAPARGWTVANATPLPLVLLQDATAAHSPAALDAVVRAVVESGAAWISTVRWRSPQGEQSAIRACITNYRTQPEDIDALFTALDQARSPRPFAHA